MPELPGIRRCVNGGDEIADVIQATTTLDELKNAVKNNATLIGRIRSFCQRENVTSIMAVMRDIGSRWQIYTDFNNEPDFRAFQDFMRDLVSDIQEKTYMGAILLQYFETNAAEKKLARGELIKPFYPNASIEIPDALTLPNVTYRVDDHGGIWQMNTSVCRGALMIVKRIELIDDDKFVYELIFQAETGKWKKVKVPNEHMLDAKKFMGHCGAGVQVTANTVKGAIGYLSAFAQSNGNDIPTVLGTTHLGWNQGKILIDTQNPNLEIIADPSVQPTLKAVSTRGTLDEWIVNVFNIAMEDRTNGKFLLGLTSVLGSLFLEPLGAPNGWFLHLYGASRSGKSTTMKAIASAIGYPINEGIWRSWNNTSVFLERHCAFMGSVGVFLDEAKTDQKNVIKDSVYMIANGMGRGRGTPGGISKTPTWKLNVVSTGEFDLKEVASQEGAENRMICVTPAMGCSFFQNGYKTASVLEENMGKYYGTLIQTYAPLVENLGQDEILERFKEAKEGLIARLDPEDIESGRVHTFLGYFAIMVVALDLFVGQILHSDEAETDLYFNAVLNEFDEFMTNIVHGHEDRAERVLNVVTSLVFSNIGKFYSNDRGDNREPPTGFLGKIISNDRNSMTVGIKPEIVQDHLSRFGFTISEFERIAEENGYLIKDGKHFKGTFRLNGGKIKGYILRLDTSENI